MITVWRENPDHGITYPEGFVVAATRCGLKQSGDDLALIVCDSEATAAGVFTTNHVQAACVQYSRRIVKSGKARGILINAGNANACTGSRGDEDNRTLAEWTSRLLNVPPTAILTASTGIIGKYLEMERLEEGISTLIEVLDRDGNADKQAAQAIMTTDTRLKMCGVEVDSDKWTSPIRFGGMCKGAGMIAPNMATMLAFLTTDARLPDSLLQKALERAVAVSFNAITVDGDTSTNDMCLMLASGMGEGEISREGDGYEDFVEALTRLCILLAKEVARDGEGATKLVEIVVKGAGNEASARQIAKTVAESPLVKTALFGNDPNWGRLLMAAGRAGVPFDPNHLDVKLGDFHVFANGEGKEFDREGASAYLNQKEITILFDLNTGEASARYWTCDYSYDYIKINADYHT